MKEKVGSIGLARIVSIIVFAVAIFGIGLLLMSNEASATPDGIATVELTNDNFMIDIVNIGDELTLQYDDSLTPTATGVTADLTDYGGTANEALYDDGTNGDPFGGDNIWTVVWTVTDPAPSGIDLPAPVTITITATDGLPPDDIQTPTIMKVAAQMPVDTIAPSITLAGSLTVSTNNVGPAGNAAITDGVTYTAGNVAVADGDVWIVDLTALTGTPALPPATEDFVIAGTLDNPGQTFPETVTDNAGNQAFGNTAPFDVDNEPPSILTMGSLTVSTNNVGPAGNAAITDGVTYSAGTVTNPDGDIWTVDLTALTGNAALLPATEDFVIAGSLNNPAQTFTETVTDNAGNPDSGNTVPFDVDNEPPLILTQGTLTVSTNNVGPAGNAAITDGVTYSAGTVTTPDGDTWTVDLTALTGNAGLPPATEDFVIAGALDNPAQTFTETVTDDAGNTGSGSTAGFDVDNEPPSILTQGTLTVSTNNVGPAGNAAITDGVTYSAGAVTIPDSDTWTVDLIALTGTAALPPATEDFVIAGTLDNPAQTFTETVTDDAGNSISGNTAPLDVDNQAPSILAPGSLTVSTNNVGPVGNAAITDGVTYTAGTVTIPDGDTWLVDLTALTGTGALPPTIEDFVIAGSLDNPAQTFTETVSDDAGNTNSGNTAPLDVDNQAPSILAPGSLAVSTNNVGPAGNAAITDGVTYSAGTVTIPDGDTWAVDLTALTGNAALPPAIEDFVIAGALDNPAQTFTETVTDDAGNTNSGNTASLDVDNEAPSILAPGSLTVSTNNVGPAGNAAITDGVTYSVGTVTIPDGDTWTVDLTALTGTVALPPATEDFVIAGVLDNPAQTFTETVIDDAGNTNSGNTLPLDVDNEAPSITAAGSLIVSTNNVGPAGNAAITDGVTYSAGTVAIPDGDTWLVNLATLTGTATLPPATEDFVIAGTLDNPTQTFTETVTDDAGNTNSGNTLPLNVDNEAPSITAAGSLTVSTNNVGPAGNAATTDGVTYSAGTVAIPDSDTWTVDLTALTGNAALPPATEDFVIAGALDNAAQTFTETVTDDAGNTGSGFTLGLDVDNELPTVGVMITQESTPAGIGEWINITVNTDADTANVDVDLAAAGFTGQADNQALTQAATFWYYNFTVAAGTYDGMNTINVDAVDDAGNADNNNTESAIWDDEAPTPTVIITQESIPAGIGKYINITATIQGDDAVSVDIDLAAFTGQVDNTAMTYITSTSTWYYNFTIATGTLDSTAITINVDATDDAGNPAFNNSQTANADESLPTIISVIVSDPLITDIDAGGVFDVRITFSEPMDMGATPVIVFENPGLFFTLTPSTNDWISATEFRQNYTITDVDEDASLIDINVTAGQDEAGNVMVYDVTADVFDVDTQNPTVTIYVSDNLITDADAGSTFYVNCSFTKNMNNGVTPTVYFDPDVTASGTLTFVTGVWNANNDWYNVSYTIADMNEEQLGVDVGLTGAQDDAGNTQVPDPFTFWDAFNVDTVNPTVTSVTINDILITDSDAGGILNITIEYSEPMDTSVNPTLTFSPDIVTSGTLIFASSDWYDSTHYRVNYTIADVNETQSNVDITADGAQNVGGVPQASYTEVDALDVDTLSPTVVSVTIDDILITDSDAGGILNITVEYLESMDTGVNPTLTFTPDIVTSGTITFTSSDWYDSTHYRVNYTIADVNEEQLNVDIDINGALDAAGNAQVAYSEIDAFDVDTLNPTVVGVTIDDIQITDSDAGNMLNITIEYSEPMNTSVNPTLTFSPNIVVSGTLTFVSSDWYDSTHYRVNYTIADVNETLLDVDINADGAQNVAGDTQVFYTDVDALDVDTMNPTVVSITIDDILITDSDAGLILNITVEYSEPMNAGVNPTLTFAPDVEGSGTLTFSSSDWFDSTHYRVNYTIADINEKHLDVNITVDGAQNVAGNSQVTYTEADAFDIDTENPTVTIIIILESTPAGIGEWVNITVTTDADATSVVGNLSDFAGQTASETFLGSGSNWYYNFTVVAGTFEGLGGINVTVTDDVGNAGYNDTETAEVDEVLPDVTITSTADMVNASYVVNTTIVGADPIDVWYKVDTLTEVQLPNIGGDNYEATIDVSALTEGAHTIQIIAYDTAGNVNDLESVDITVDHTLPEVNITSTEATVHASYELTVIITDTNIDTGNLSYSIDDGTPVALTLVSGDDYNATIDTSSLEEVQHTIKVIAYDLAGNINAFESIVITIDHSAPSVTVSDLPTLVNSATLTVSGTTEPNALVEVLIDDFVVATVTADTAGDFSVDISLSEGQNNVVIRATDEAGNVAETSPQIVERDTTPPVAPDLGDLPAEVTKSSLTITGTTEPGANVEILVDDVLAAQGTADANGDFSIEITLEKGEHQIQARATDEAGNTALSSVLTIKYEEEAPTDYTLYIIIVVVIVVLIILVLLLTRKRGKKEKVEGEIREEVAYEELEEAPEVGVEEPEEEVSYEEEFAEIPEEELGALEEEEVTYEEGPEEEMISEEEAPEEEVYEEEEYAEEGLEFECPDCGTPVPGDVTKCPKCGAEFEEVEEGEEEEME